MKDYQYVYVVLEKVCGYEENQIIATIDSAEPVRAFSSREEAESYARAKENAPREDKHFWVECEVWPLEVED